MIPVLYANTRLFQSSDIMPSFTGDIDYGIIAAVVLIAVFIMYVTLKNNYDK